MASRHHIQFACLLCFVLFIASLRGQEHKKDAGAAKEDLHNGANLLSDNRVSSGRAVGPALRPSAATTPTKRTTSKPKNSDQGLEQQVRNVIRREAKAYLAQHKARPTDLAALEQHLASLQDYTRRTMAKTTPEYSSDQLFEYFYPLIYEGELAKLMTNIKSRTSKPTHGLQHRHAAPFNDILH
jgi:hypothetical protein